MQCRRGRAGDRSINRQEQECGCRDLSCGGCKRRDAYAAKPPLEDARARVGQRGAEHGELGCDVRPDARKRGRPDHQDDAGKADDHAREPVARHALIRGDKVGDDDGEEWRRGVQDGGEYRGDVSLAPHDQAERHDVIQETHADEGCPDAAVASQSVSREWQNKVENQSRKRCAQRHEREGRQSREGHAREEERPTPEHGKGEQHSPLG